MIRYDFDTDEWTGFVIFDDRGPLQAMYRRYGFTKIGNDNGVYWLRPAPITPDFDEFLDFAEMEIRTHHADDCNRIKVREWFWSPFSASYTGDAPTPRPDSEAPLPKRRAGKGRNNLTLKL